MSVAGHSRRRLTLSPLLPVYPNERTSRDRPGWSVLCREATSRA